MPTQNNPELTAPSLSAIEEQTAPSAETSKAVSRRQFVRNACGLCGLAFIGATALLETGCSSGIAVVKSTKTGNRLAVATSAFATTNMVQVRNNDLDWDILLVKNGETYTALQLKCTHHEEPLSPTPTKLHCNDHGSEFDLQGNVTNGPAKRPVLKYPTVTEGGTIYIIT